MYPQAPSSPAVMLAMLAELKRVLQYLREDWRQRPVDHSRQRPIGRRRLAHRAGHMLGRWSEWLLQA